MSNPTLGTVQVIFHGRVQGVGFRATTADIARQFGVTGYVRNQSDGTVELVARGDMATLKAFLSTIENRFTRNITTAPVEQGSSDEIFESFEIR